MTVVNATADVELSNNCGTCYGGLWTNEGLQYMLRLTLNYRMTKTYAMTDFGLTYD
jgi:hypothetical protein